MGVEIRESELTGLGASPTTPTIEKRSGGNMKIGDIKIEAIKLMFTNYALDLSINDLQTLLSDENYGSYFVNMPGSIGRALDRIQNACVMPLKSYVVKDEDCEILGSVKRFDTKVINDLYLIDRITASNTNFYDANAPFDKEGDFLIFDNDNTQYTVLYYPTIKTVTAKDSDNDELWIPDYLARLIPYFIKGELYQEEEPELAAAARNLFEASLDDLKVSNESKQNYVKQVYRFC